MIPKRLKSTVSWLARHKLVLSLLLSPVMVLGFFISEHVRGDIMLARYLRALGAQGERITARELRLPPPEPDQNGAPEVLAQAKGLRAGTVLPGHYPPRMKLMPSGRALVGFREEQWVEDRATNHWEQLASDLAANGNVLEEIRSAMAKPVFDCQLDLSQGPFALFPHLPVPKTLTQWFGSSLELALHQGRTRESLTDLVTEINLVRLLERDGIVISELVRYAVAAIARGDTWEALQADGWTDEDLAQIQRAWEKQTFISGSARGLEGERVFAGGSYTLMRKSNKETADILYGLAQFLPSDERPRWEKQLNELPGGEVTVDFLKKEIYCRLWRFAWLDQDHAHYLRYLRQLIALGRDATREKSLAKMQPAVDELVLRFQNRGLYDRLRYPSVMSVDSLSRALARAMRAETERSLVLAAIALKRYTLRHGGPPQALAALVPEFLMEVPTDYMDGQPLRYRLQPDGGFVLYSLGEDGKDDGGDAGLRSQESSSRVIWNRKDVVWPAPATTEEVQAYHAAPAKY